MKRRFQQVVRASIVVAVFLSLMVASSVAQACRRCGVPCCPTYQLVQKTVYSRTMVPETRIVNCTEYRPEIRERTVTVQRCVPETKQVRQVYTVMVPQTRVREEPCVVTRPVWEEVDQTYTVCVPYQEKRQGTRTVCRPVQVQEMHTVCRDEGHWEQTSCCQPARMAWGCFGGLACGSCAPIVCCTQMVWVPNIVTEQVPVTVSKMEVVEEPCEYMVTLYRQEQRSRKVRVCRYVNETKTRQVQYTVCVPQQRECLRNVTTYRTVAEQRVQRCTVMVPHVVQKQVTVMTCRMVPQVVTCRVPVSCGCCGGCG